MKHIREPEPLTRLASLAALDKPLALGLDPRVRRPLASGERRCTARVTRSLTEIAVFPALSAILAAIYPWSSGPGLLSPHLLASGGVATNVSRGGSGWQGRRLLSGGSSWVPPVSHPAPGVRGLAVRWGSGSLRGNRCGPSHLLSASLRAPLSSWPAETMICSKLPDAGRDDKSLFLPTTAWTCRPAPPPFS